MDKHRYPDIPAGHGPGGKPCLVRDRPRPFLELPFAGDSAEGNAAQAGDARAMIEPQLGKPGESPDSGSASRSRSSTSERRIGHGGAIYGFATEVEALPDAKLGASSSPPRIAPMVAPSTSLRPPSGSCSPSAAASRCRSRVDQPIPRSGSPELAGR